MFTPKLRSAATAAAASAISGVIISSLVGFNPLLVAPLFALISLLLPASDLSRCYLKILWGAGVVDGRGKLNGWVFSKNKAGGYARTKVTPSNPQTTHQLLYRSRLGSLSQQWKSMTDEQRSKWDTLGKDHPVSDIFGNSRTLQGLNMFVSVNQNIYTTGGATLFNAKSFTGVPAVEIDVVDFKATTQALDFTLKGGDIPAGFTLAVYASPQVSAGKMNVKSLVRLFTTATTGGLLPIDVSAAYTSRFGIIQAGGRASIYIRLIDNITGEAGLSSSVSIIAT